MSVTFSNPDGLHTPLSNYAQVAVVNLGTARLLLVSGQVALDPAGQLVGPGDPARQAEQIFENIRAALAAHGATLRDVAKLTLFFTDIAHRRVVADVRARYFPDTAPASSAFEVRRLASDDFLLEIEAIAALPA